MRTEALDSARVVENQISENQQLLDEVAQYLNQKNPYSLVSIARGSSDHAAQYLNYLTTAKMGKLTTSLSLSALTIYEATLDVSKSVGVSISQSGHW
jgi:glucosamine--fructose-6-phosphate aminotransferase (isomerizing)